MARNQRQRRVAGLGGLRLDLSELDKDPRDLISSKNVYMQDGRIVGRKGAQPLTPREAFDLITDIHTYTFSDPDTGEVQQELIGVKHEANDGDYLYKLNNETVTLLHNGSGVTTATITLKPVDGEWEGTLYEDGVALAGWPKTYSSGYNLGGIKDFTDDLDAETNWSATWSGSGLSLSLAQDASIASIGHMIEVDALTSIVKDAFFWDALYSEAVSNRGLGVEVEPFDSDRISVSFKNSSDLCFIADNGAYLSLYDSQNYYRAGMPEFIRQPVATLSSGALTGTYKYLFRYSFRNARGSTVVGEPSTSFFELSTSPSSQDVDLEFPQFINNLPADASLAPDRPQQLFTVNGLQSGVNAITVDAYDAALLDIGDEVTIYDTGTSSWQVRNVTATSSTSLTVDGATVDVADNSIIAKDSNIQYLLDYGKATGASTSGVVPFSAGHPFNAGDTVLFLDSNSSSWVFDTIASTTTTSVTFTNTGRDVALGAFITKGLGVDIYRTKAGGSIYYFVDTVALPTHTDTPTYSDSKLDADLGAEFINTEKDLSPPPKCSLVEEHQGLLVLSGNRTQPNTVFYSEPNSLLTSIQNFPSDSAFDAPSSTVGGITAIGSENSVLNIFKEISHYPVIGNLIDNSFQFGRVNEGSLGVSSQSSLQLVNGALVGVGRYGFVRVENGVADTSLGDPVRALFRQNRLALVDGEAVATENEDILHPVRARGVMYGKLGLYMCFIPAMSGTPGTNNNFLPNDNSKLMVLDIETLNWYVWAFEGLIFQSSGEYFSVYPQGGMSVYNDSIHYSMYYFEPNLTHSLLHRENVGDISGSDESQKYYDDNKPITYDIWLSDDFGDDPMKNKDFKDLGVMCVDTTENISFSTRVRTYRNLNRTTSDTDTTVTVSPSGSNLFNLASNKAKSLSCRLTVATGGQRPRISAIIYSILGDWDNERYSK